MKTTQISSDLRMLTFDTREEWLTARANRIGGSDASAVIGVNPWKTNQELWEEKTGKVQPQDISDKPYVQYGQNTECYLRELFKLDFPEYEVGYVPNNIFLNRKYPFAHASLDGWIRDKRTGSPGILEIKTTNIVASSSREKWKDRIPDNYYAQICWYMMVTGWDFVILKAQLRYENPNDLPTMVTKHYRIDREDAQNDIDYLAEHGEKFWKCVENNTPVNLILPDI